MDLLKGYTTAQAKLFDYFGYVEDWRILPVDDATDYYWCIDGTESDGNVQFADDRIDLADGGSGNHYENEIYKNRHLPKWVYRGKDYTMICVDTHTDGNQLLQIFSNELEVK